MGRIHRAMKELNIQNKSTPRHKGIARVLRQFRTSRNNPVEFKNNAILDDIKGYNPENLNPPTDTQESVNGGGNVLANGETPQPIQLTQTSQQSQGDDSILKMIKKTSYR